jgi:hypothetical protein
MLNIYIYIYIIGVPSRQADGNFSSVQRTYIPVRPDRRHMTHRRQCKMSSSKNIVMERDFAAGVYLSEAQSPIPLRPDTLYTGIQVYLFTLGRGEGWKS